MDYEFDDEPYVDRLEGYVCPACVTDAFLKQALQDALEDENCSYCDAAQAAPTSVLLKLLGEAVTFYFTDPAEQSPYDGREGDTSGRTRKGMRLSSTSSTTGRTTTIFGSRSQLAS